MELHGKNILGDKTSSQGALTFAGVNPSTHETLLPHFYEATSAEIKEALALAERAFEEYRKRPAEKIVSFLDLIAEEILRLGDELIQRAHQETGLPEQRLIGERARTIGQIKMFAELLREGSWKEVCIDRAILDRKPLPKPDLRRMLIPIGPVVVFGASNFPLAFSVAGGDTISALAAGNSVVVKAHPAHPGTSELVARAIQSAIKISEMPSGIFSMLQGTSHEVGLELVRHPSTKAVGFTGSLQAGRALFDAAAARPEPIPVYAEMGSTNPVFILPGALQKNLQTIAEGLIQSVTLGVGQFCTNPGLVFGVQSEDLAAFANKTAQLATAIAPGTMLHAGICDRFQESVQHVEKIPGVSIVGRSANALKKGQAGAVVLSANTETFLKHEKLREEIFGPSTLIVHCASAEELEKIARNISGQLTATIFGSDEDLANHRHLISILEQKVGRLVFNNFPTGVEVCPSMHHGGPYPATTDAHFTSVGSAAIKRFARPICFQNFPDKALPIELQNKNARNVWRLVDNQLTKDDL